MTGGRPIKLLIVDDNPIVRRVIRRIVEDGAGEIHECADGSVALGSYIAHRPDLVLMDIDTTAVAAIAATRQIRQADPDARIVIVTDYDEPDLRVATREAGASGYVLKDNLMELKKWVIKKGVEE
jgi:DNA-binding NarL/FixJ family response regulator